MEVGKATHFCSQHSPASQLAPLQSWTLVYPSEMTSRPAHPFARRFCIPSAHAVQWGVLGGLAPTPLWSKGSQCNRVLAPSTGMDTARHGSAVHATQWCTSSLCPSSRHPGCRASESQFGQSVSVSFMKGQAGALGAVFLWFLVWGTYSPHTGVHTWHLPGKVIS